MGKFGPKNQNCQFKVNESWYIALHVVSGFTKKLFLNDFVIIELFSVFFPKVFVNTYLFSIFFPIVFANIYLFMFFSIDFTQ